MMMVTISGPHFQRATAILQPNNGHEAGLLALFGIADVSCDPWTGKQYRKFSSHEIVPIQVGDIVSSSPHHFTWRKSTFIKLLRRAKRDNLAVAFIHSHRRGVGAFFSKYDDQNDFAIAELAKNCIKSEVDLLSMVIDDEGHIAARRCSFNDGNQDIEKIFVLGDRSWRIVSRGGPSINAKTFERQSLAFGDGFLDAISQLNIVVAGAGATGSATAMLLARHGASQLALVDPDVVELSNISRLHGARVEDADLGKSKVAVLKREIERIGLGTKVLGFRKRCHDASLTDLFLSSDVVFCCTDDHVGRLYLNRLAYFYNLPVLDMGIGIDPHLTLEGNAQSVDARVSYLAAGSACLLCRGSVDPVRARNEELAIVNSLEYQEQMREGYIAGFDVAEPAVGYITTSVACMAIDELVARLTGYRQVSDNRVRKFRLRKDTFPGSRQNEECSLCTKEANWGRGDIEPFLDRVG